MTTIEIPADVRDNSEAVTDYAFSRNLSTHLKPPTPASRDKDINLADLFGYTHYRWFGTTQGDRDGYGAGQRYRVDLLVDRDGKTVNHFLTLYFTRVGCASCEYSYAQRFAQYADAPEGHHPIPLCGDHLDFERRAARHDGRTLLESEPLRIGQH